MILNVLGFFVWLALSLCVHELFHSFIADNLGYKAKIRFFNKIGGKKRYGVHTVVTPYPSRKDDFTILGGGFIGGFLLVAIYVLSVPNQVFGLTMVALYVFFTRDDLKQLFFLRRSNNV